MAITGPATREAVAPPAPGRGRGEAVTWPSPGRRCGSRSLVTTIRSALNLINIDESEPAVNPCSRTDRTDTLRDLNHMAAVAVSRVAEEQPVHARVNLHNWEVAIDQVEPPAVASPLANPGVPFDPRSIY